MSSYHFYRYMGKNQKTYHRDWSAYNTSQVEELNVVVGLIRSMVDSLNIKEISDFQRRAGRSAVQTRDILKCCLLQQYMGLSDRRLEAWLWLLKEKLELDGVPNFSTICKHANDPELKDYYEQLLEKTNEPVKDLEHSFSTDASGFGTKNTIPWVSVRTNKGTRKDYVKGHFTIGRTFKIISAVTVTRGRAGDSPQLPEHVEKTTSIFTQVYSWCLDSAYLARKNCNLLWSHGIFPFIKPKSNSTINKKGSMAWRRMMELFRYLREIFDAFYHGRSISETVNSTMKRLMNPVLRKKNWSGQVNEVLSKTVIYNLICLTRAIFTMKIDLKPLLH